MEIVSDGTNWKILHYDSIFAYAKHTETSGTNGGSSTANTVQTRTINNLTGDTGFASIATNQITLVPGTYEIIGFSEAYEVSRHQVFLYSITGSTYDLDGTSVVVALDGTSTSSNISGQIIVTSTEVFELRHWTQGTKATTGLGFAADNHASNPQSNEVYAQLKITKIR